MDPKPIPAFYCCYLLRSKQQGRSFYIGSTPNPRRRLAQHNGDKKGGAVRTRIADRRPWDMTCIVTGFPSNIAALQFEWAWQNFHTTKKIPDEQRLHKPKEAKKRTKSKPQPPSVDEPEKKKRKKLQRPQLTLNNSLSNLHLLLRVPSFNKWPLAVRFLCQNVYNAWKKHSESANGKLPEDFRVFRDFEDFAEPIAKVKLPTTAVGEKEESPTMAILEKIDVTYSRLKPHVAKSIAIAVEMRVRHCFVCEESIEPGNSMFLVCPSEQCSAVSHMACLGKKWLQDQPTPGILLPLSGTCSQCNREHQWVDLVKEASIRARGGKHLTKLMKEPRVRKPKVTARSASSNSADSERIPERSPEDLQAFLEDSLTDIGLLAIDPEDDPLPDAWQEHIDNDDNISVTSTESGMRSRDGSPERSSKQRQKLEVVIEDSEWDSAEVLD
ncbi:MAG: hypothetical protein Q9169_002540 [Polycauliona sp. 2 TL-2023]